MRRERMWTGGVEAASRKRRRGAVTIVALLLSTAGVEAGLSPVRSAILFENAVAPFGPGANDGVGSALAVGDFDCDGLDDLAIGAPFDDLNGIGNAGSVEVRYGMPGLGLDPGFAPLFLSQLFGLSPDPAETGDLLGRALAAGDFNGDGCDDLAIAIPNESRGGQPAAGAVQIHYGGVSGLDDNATVLFDQDSAADFGGVAVGNFFGSALAAGDFDGGGIDDLAIGVPFGDLPSSGPADAGLVIVLSGTLSGLTTSGARTISQGVTALDLVGAPAANDRFGAALAAGDFNDDGADDLAIGVPGDLVFDENSPEPVENAGSVNVVYGSVSGLTATGNQKISQDSGSIADAAETEDGFGSALAVGDFNDFSGADLAIGAPGEDLGAAANAGVVHILLGTPGGLATVNAFYWDQEGTHVEVSEPGDLWGSALAAGDFDGEGRDELAVGAWSEDLPGGANAGQVIVLDGPPGPFAAGELWHQDVAGVPDGVETGDRFGEALAVGDFDGDGHADLAVGVPNEASAFSGQGGVALFCGALFSDGFESAESCRWSESSPGDPSC